MKPKMLIENVFMELRARLRSCNVYITTTIDFSKNCNLKINIQSNCITLNYYNNNSDKFNRRDSLSSIESLSDCYSEDDSDDTIVIPLGEFCHIIPNSMSGLKIEKNNISFRILTESKNGGTFYTELLKTNADKPKHETHHVTFNVKIGDDVKINCKNCSNTVSKDKVQFKRVLELPTSNLDMSEWFCCNHGGCSQPITEVKPANEDFLYRLTYFVLSLTVLSEKSLKFNSKRELYHCNRCLAWLGIKNKDTVKLFNSTVKLEQNGEEAAILNHQNSLSQNPDINDFIYTIESLAKEFNLGLQYNLLCKIILECSISTNKKQYLLIWIMDKELQVLQNSDCINGMMKLKSSYLAKILYKTEDSLNEEVESWISDPSVVSTEVSKPVFFSGIDHLNQMSMKVPESFRSTNGFSVSYLKV